MSFSRKSNYLLKIFNMKLSSIMFVLLFCVYYICNHIEIVL